MEWMHQYIYCTINICVSLKVLQRDRTNRMYVYRKKSATEIGLHDYAGWEVPISAVSKLDIQDSHWHNCSPSLRAWTRRADGVNSVQRLIGSRSEKSWCLSPKAGRGQCPSLCSQAVGVPSCSWEGQSLFSYSSLQLIWWGPPTVGRTICFTQPTDSNVNHTKKNLRDTPRKTFDQISRDPVNQTSWHIKLIIKIFQDCIKCFTSFNAPNNKESRNSLVVQWLGLNAFTPEAQVQSLLDKIKSYKSCGEAKKNPVITLISILVGVTLGT